MTVTEKLDKFILIEGDGNVRDALNIALARLDSHQHTIEAKDAHVHNLLLEIDQLKADLEMVGASF